METKSSLSSPKNKVAALCVCLLGFAACTQNSRPEREIPKPRRVEVTQPAITSREVTLPQPTPSQNTVDQNTTTPALVNSGPPSVTPTLNQPMPPPAPAMPVTSAARVGLILGPGGLKAFSHLGVLKELEKANIQIHSIVGLEWGALVAGLYANKGRVNDVEWKLFKLRKENLPKEKMFKTSVESETMATMAPYLTEVLGNQTIESGRISFGCPTIDVKRNQVAWVSRGGLKDAMDHCMPYPPAFLPHKDYAAAPFEIETAARKLREAGAQLIVFVNVIPQGPLADESKFEAGITGQILWGQVRRTLAERRTAIDYVIDVSSGNYDMMDFKELRNMVNQGQAAGARAVGPITNKIGM